MAYDTWIMFSMGNSVLKEILLNSVKNCSKKKQMLYMQWHHKENWDVINLPLYRTDYGMPEHHTCKLEVNKVEIDTSYSSSLICDKQFIKPLNTDLSQNGIVQKLQPPVQTFSAKTQLATSTESNHFHSLYIRFVRSSTQLLPQNCYLV